MALAGFASAFLLVFASFAPAQEILATSLVVPGDAKAVQIVADNLTTWQEGNRRVLLLQGKVWIDQGINRFRGTQAVVWVDEKARKDSGVYLIDVYGEGDTTLEQGNKREGADRAYLRMSTRGDIRMQSYAAPAQSKDRSSDPLYQRAKQAKDAQTSVAKAETPASRPASPPPAVPPPLLADSLRQNAQPLAPTTAYGGAIQQVQGVAPIPGAPGPSDPPSQPPPFPQPPGPATPTPGPAPDPAKPETRKLIIRPRTGFEIQARNYPQENGETAIVVTTGVILSVTDPANPSGNLDIEADRLVFWTKGNSQQIFGNMQSQDGQQSKQMEFFLSGNVEIRSKSGSESVTLRASEVYYDVGRSVAIALRADMEIQDPKSPYPAHMRSDELLQLNSKLWTAQDAVIYSSTLPSDPQLRIEVRDIKLTESDRARRSIFGREIIDRKTGAPNQEKLLLFEGQQNFVYIGNVPVFYYPFIRTNSKRPFGPLEGLDFGYNQIYGFQTYTKWDVYELLGTTPIDGTDWKAYLDYMDRRGPAVGTRFDYRGEDAWGIPNKYSGVVKAYGLRDGAFDLLGGNRGQYMYLTPTTFENVYHPEWRGRFLWQNRADELPGGFSVLSQVAFISDHNFLEQYFFNEWNQEVNQQTFVQVKQQNDNWAWTGFANVNDRNWLNETEWFPKLDGYVIGQSLFDRFTYTTHTSAGAGKALATTGAPFSYFPTDVAIATSGSPVIGRFDTMNEIALPLHLGDFTVVPYLRGDLAYYTSDNAGNAVGRVYGAYGVRGSVPLSKYYDQPYSEVFNVDSLYHKIVASVNYYNAATNTGYGMLPQMDRLNDDPSDQALRDMRNWQLKYIDAATANQLIKNPLFDPQNYAVRRLVDTQVDTIDNIDVAQFGLRQRLQTKRGFPGDEHVVDWMVLDTTVSVFPQAQRDNFGQTWGIFEYDYIWNIGDRTALLSRGMFEPFSEGPRVFNISGQYTRPDNTVFSLGYRSIDPIQSKAVLATVSYQLSTKYYVSMNGIWDFGLGQEFYNFAVTRKGTDLQVSLGFSFNSAVNTFGVNFSIVPNLARPDPGAAALNNNNINSRR